MKRVLVTIDTDFGNPKARDDGRTLARLDALDAACRHALPNLDGPPRLLAEFAMDLDDDSTFKYTLRHTFTFTDAPDPDELTP